MVTENNSQINYFTGGMNSDVSYDMLKENQYTLAKNVRIFSLNRTGDHILDNAQGQIRPIEGLRQALVTRISGKIVACGTVRQYGIIVSQDAFGWAVWRFENCIGYPDIKDDAFNIINGIHEVFRSTSPLNKGNIERISAVIRYEDEHNIKLYIADGENPLYVLNVSPDADAYNASLGGDSDLIRSYPKQSLDPPTFVKLTKGTLQPALVQYSYRLYNKYGIATEISPATKQIPIVNNYYENWNRGKAVEGILSTDKSTCGVVINIPKDNYAFDQMQIYRITYVENGQLPTVEVIYDGDRMSGYFTDAGLVALTTITLEEYNSITGYHIVPEVIESKNDYLFAANIGIPDDWEKSIKDYDARAFSGNIDTHIATLHNFYNQSIINATVDLNNIQDVPQTIDAYNINNDVNKPYNINGDVYDKDGYFGGTGKNISWRFVVGELYGDTSSVGFAETYHMRIEFGKSLRRTSSQSQATNSEVVDNTADPRLYYVQYGGQKVAGPNNKSITDFFINPESSSGTYADPTNSMLLKSLRRDELYRYGIVFYNKYQEASPVKWIADIRTPSIKCAGFETFAYNYNENGKELTVFPLGIEFKVNNMPAGAVAYEIVRCNRGVSDMSTISQGVISRPIMKHKWENVEENGEAVTTAKYPYMPTGFITVSNFWTGKDYKYRGSWDYDDVLSGEKQDGYEADNFENTTVFQFISPEICYQKDSMKDLFKIDNLSLSRVIGLNPVRDEIVGTLNVSGDSYYLPSPNAALIKKTVNKSVVGDTIDTIYQRNYTTMASYYMVEPSEHSSIENNIEYSYVDAAGVKHTMKGGAGSWHRIKRSVHAYIKLYKALYDSPQVNAKVSSIKIAEEAGWNDAFGELSGENSETAALKYKNFTTVVGSHEYLNWVANGAYDVKCEISGGSESMGNKDYYNDGWNNTADDTIFGPGGRCAVLEIESDNDAFGINVPTVNIGTYICNLKQPVVPYYGGSFESRLLNTYYSSGAFYRGTSDAVVFDGDCFIAPLDYVSMHKYYTQYCKDSGISHQIGYAIPLETNINLAYTSGYEYSRHYRDTGVTNIQIEPSKVYDAFVQDKPLYEYNTAYNAAPKVRMFAAEDLTKYDYDHNFDYRVYYSNLKQNDELIDSWIKFMPANYLDVDTKYGAITHLRSFHDRLLFWQERATGLLSVNERAQITDDNNMPLILGTSGVLARYDYLDDTAGMHEKQFCDTMSDSSLYWWDEDNQEIKRYSDGNRIINLSKTKGVQNILHKNSYIEKWPLMTFDSKNNEILANVLKNNTIVYGEYSDVFTSIYDIDFVGACRFANGMYLVGKKGDSYVISQWNCSRDKKPRNFDGKILNMYVSFVVNKQPVSTKVFDNQEIVTVNKYYDKGLEDASYGYSINNNIDKKAYFSRHHKYSWTTDINKTSSTLENEITLREGNYRYSIPRVNNSEFGGRIRGKYMICEIDDTNPTLDASMSYVITKFRASWT